MYPSAITHWWRPSVSFIGFPPKRVQRGRARTNRASCDLPALGIPPLQLQPQAGPPGVRPQAAAVRLRRALEQQVLDAGVVVEKLDVLDGGCGAAGLGVERRRAVGG